MCLASLQALSATEPLKTGKQAALRVLVWACGVVRSAGCCMERQAIGNAMQRIWPN